MSGPKIKNLGDLLLESGAISRETLDRALEIQNRRLGEILVEENLVDPKIVAQALSEQARIAGGGVGQARLSVEVQALEKLLSHFDTLENRLFGQLEQRQVYDPALVVELCSLRAALENLLLDYCDTVFRRLSRVVEHASRVAGKQIQVYFSGATHQIDRTLLDDLHEIGLHIIRNAIDHGVEHASQRAASRKPAWGKLDIAVLPQGNSVLFTITDDGSGIDLDAVHAKALQLGLTTAPRASLSSDQIIDFLFAPNFSTKQTHASEDALSGRGVGLDVVSALVKRRGGTIRVVTTPQKGTSFQVELPLKYSRQNVVPVCVGTQWFAVVETQLSQVRILNATDTIPQDSKFASDLLFGAPVDADAQSAHAAKSGQILLRTQVGSSWIFDQIKSAETLFVRGQSAGANQASPHVIGLAILGSYEPAPLLDFRTPGNA